MADKRSYEQDEEYPPPLVRAPGISAIRPVERIGADPQTNPQLAEIILRAEAAREDEVVSHLWDAHPEGFRHDELPDGRHEYGIYVPEPDADITRERLVRQLSINDHDMSLVAGDWHERWKEFHRPVIIDTLWVGPPWELPAPVDYKNVVIEPGQGFGTGAHATTYLVLAALQKQQRTSVLDIGCGSGVLSVAAHVLGFSPVTACDNDHLAVDSTRDNLKRNGITGISVSQVDAINDRLPEAELVLANLTLEPLVQIVPRLKCRRAIVSGILKSQYESAVAAFEGAGFVVRERFDRDGWLALVLDRADVTSPISNQLV